MKSQPVAPTLPALLSLQAQQRGERQVYTYLRDGEHAEHTLTFAQLDTHARTIATRLQRKLGPGDRALVVMQNELEFVRAFLGCQCAGVVPVPVSFPFPLEAHIGNLRAIARDCRAHAILSDATEEVRELICAGADELESLPWIDFADVGGELAAELRPVRVRPDDIAFLQYTSGSTATPKGVIVTHEALMHNELLATHWMGIREGDVFVSWLPLFHDMGLIGNMLLPLYAGVRAVLMPPLSFVQRPERWLRAISRYRGTISGGPNFGYELCARRVDAESCEGLDLSSWRWAYNGAEPVRSSTLAAFNEAFRAYGFDRRALAPCYGLAESTLLVVGTEREHGAVQLQVDAQALGAGRLVPGDDHSLVASGVPMLHRRVEVVEPSTGRRLAPGEIGEIWVAGPDVARGYWGQPLESARTFAARIADDDDGPFLRTGDLGAIHDGHLFVTGRLKDVIIVAGRNHYPHDIEMTVEDAHPLIRRGCCAAFAHEGEDRERVVVVAEIKLDGEAQELDPDGLRRLIRTVVARKHEIEVAHVALVPPRSLPKTSSGKLQRSACRIAFEREELPSVERESMEWIK